MPPTEKTKINVKIADGKRFTFRGRLYGPGEWPVDEDVAQGLVEEGRAKLVGGKSPAPAKKAPEGKVPEKNPRIPPPPPEEDKEPTETPLPDDFPSKEVLEAAGFATVESLKAPDIKEALAKVEGLTGADITKIGLAISKL